MKKNGRLFSAVMLVVLFVISGIDLKAQDESPVDVGLDLYSSYVWRGAKYGSGPAFQPWVEGSIGGLAIGGWGSVNASADESMEMDLYLSYGFDFGLSFTLTDYYFGDNWTEYAATHYLEPMLSFETGNFSITAAYMLLPEGDDVLNDDGDVVEEGAGFGEEGDIYFEAAYSFGGKVDLALGAGDGQYTEDGDFTLCNITVGSSKEIKITDSFSLPVSGAVTLNPSTGGFFISVGISL